MSVFLHNSTGKSTRFIYYCTILNLKMVTFFHDILYNSYIYYNYLRYLHAKVLHQVERIKIVILPETKEKCFN